MLRKRIGGGNQSYAQLKGCDEEVCRRVLYWKDVSTTSGVWLEKAKALGERIERGSAASDTKREFLMSELATSLRHPNL
jgi:hypothetical protein